MDYIEDNKNDEVLAFAVFFPILCLTMQTLFYGLFGVTRVIHLIILFSASIPMFFSVRIWFNNNLITPVLSYVTVLVICAFSFVLFPENRVGYWDRLVDLFIICLPSFINFVLIKNRTVIVSIMAKISWAVLICGEISIILKVLGLRIIGETYSMAFSYYMLLPSLFFMYQYSNNRNRGCLIASILGFLSIVLIGSRGAMIAWLSYCVLSAFFITGNRMARWFIIGASVSCICFAQLIINILDTISNAIGIHSRTINMMKVGELVSYDSGRWQIRNKAFEAIKNHCIVGNGIGSEYRIMGTYSHNVFVDLLLHFGIIIGSIFIAILIVIMIISFIKEMDKQLFWLFFCYGFFPSLVSGTYLTDMSFWIFCGYCTRGIGVKLVLSRGRRTPRKNKSLQMTIL